ncbi:MAG: type II secretion system F family protein [Betaproteobacteria bacterium]
MEFTALTLTKDNRVASMSITARDEADARAQLARNGLFVSSLRARPSGLLQAASSHPGRDRRFNLVLFSQELLALLQAGLGVVEAIEALAEKESQPLAAAVMGQLLEGLREGRRLSMVLADRPEVFTPLFVGMVRTAEGTSDLPSALSRFIDHSQKVSVVRNKLVSASIYPAILVLVGGAIALFLIGYVVPRFAEVFEGTGRPMPWMSRILLDTGLWLSANGWLALAVAVLAVLLAAVSLRHALDRVGLTGLLTKFPGIGPQLRIVELSRLYLTLGMLVEGGIPVVAAMEIAQGVVSPALRAALSAARGRIEAGLPVSTAFEVSGLTTPISLRLLRVGERSGHLGRQLVQSASFYDGETSRWIDRFTRSVEPLLMAGIGVVVGLIVVMLYMPIFDLAGGM